MSTLEVLKQFTTVVADTGDFKSIAEFKPQDATTNPSLLLAAAQLPQYQHLVEEAINFARKQQTGQISVEEMAHVASTHLAVAFGAEILKLVPGRVSTEVPAALSFDTEATITEAINIIDQYQSLGISKDRILIKVASTWEGIQAAAVLERDHEIHCNLTLLFNLAQAIACAEANVTLVSPFVGRILDWYKASTGRTEYPASEDPGVVSVKSIYVYFKKFNYKTVIMGASFRNVEEIKELSGVDFLTISPTLLDQLAKSSDPLERKLTPESASTAEIQKLHMTRELFDQMMASDPMATELLAQGIKKFDLDFQKLADWLKSKISA